MNTNLQLITLAISEIENNYFRFDDSILRIITEQISNYPIYRESETQFGSEDSSSIMLTH